MLNDRILDEKSSTPIKVGGIESNPTAISIGDIRVYNGFTGA